MSLSEGGEMTRFLHRARLPGYCVAVDPPQYKCSADRFLYVYFLGLIACEQMIQIWVGWGSTGGAK